MFGYDLHPALSSAPAGVLILVLIFELLGKFQKGNFETTNLYLIRIWAISTALSFITGHVALGMSPVLSENTLDSVSLHQALGKGVLFFGATLVLFSELQRVAPPANKIVVKYLYFTSLSLCLILLLITSYQGGILVFEKGVGVKI